MKVTCKKCGKIFDYDTYMGICPGCAAYYSMSCSCNNDLNEELLHDKYSKSVEREYRKEKGESTHKYFDTDSVKEVFKQFADGAKGNADERYDERSGEKTDKSSISSNSNRSSSRTAGKSKNSMPGVAKAIIIFIVIVNFGLPILGGIFSVIGSIVDSGTVSLEDEIINFIDEEVEEDYFEDGYYDEEIHDNYDNRIINYDCDGVGWVVDICDAEFETQFSDVTESGYEIISIPYYIYGDMSDDADIPGKIAETSTPCVVLQDGSCVYPESKETIGDFLGIEEEDYSIFGISDNFTLPYGKLYFCVESGQEVGMMIDIIDDDGVVDTVLIEEIFE